MTTRGRPRSWIRFEALAAPPLPGLVNAIRTVAGPLDHLERRLGAWREAACEVSRDDGSEDGDRGSEVLRFHPWAAAAYKALLGFTEGREVESRFALDALRFGLDHERRSLELDRVQGESDRQREKSHHV